MIYFNGKKVEIKKFPNGEALIENHSLKIKDAENEIKVRFESDEDIAHLIFLKGHMDELRVNCSLVVPYMPYSRMDRTEGVTVFTLKHLCRLINSLSFESVTIYEPHSDVTTALLDRVNVINMSPILAEEILKDLKKEKEEAYLVYPDAGAAKRYGKQLAYDKVLIASKERDFKTGRINKLSINGDAPTKGFKAVIIDDLCSKGGTFVLTASRLKEMGAAEVYLVVTHCENTIFEGELLGSDLIKKIYTTDSILSKSHEKITIYNI